MTQCGQSQQERAVDERLLRGWLDCWLLRCTSSVRSVRAFAEPLVMQALQPVWRQTVCGAAAWELQRKVLCARWRSN